MLLPLSAKDVFLDARGVPWMTRCFSYGLDAFLLVHLTGSPVGLGGSLQLCLVPPLSAKTRVCCWKLGSCKESWSSLQHSSPSMSAPAQFTRMVLKVLFLCYWMSSFPGREGTWSERWENWLNSRWGCFATDGFRCMVFSPPSAIQYGGMSWSCSGSSHSHSTSQTSLSLPEMPWSAAVVLTDLACTCWVSPWQLRCS